MICLPGQHSVRMGMGALESSYPRGYYPLVHTGGPSVLDGFYYWRYAKHSRTT